MGGAIHYLVSTCIIYLLLQVELSKNVVSQSIVRYLPGFTGPLPFELETGYVSIDDVQLFYYFVKSENNPSEDPVVVWINGGPGCSALTALAFEFGPIHFKIAEYDGSLPSLVLNPHSWTKLANIIFLDAPVGTGYSYSRSLQGSYTSDTKSAIQTSTFVRKWLTEHPEYLSNPLYIGGDSYSGIPVPIIVQDLSDGIAAGVKPVVNLKGYMLGNPSTDQTTDKNYVVPFAHGMGIISDELFESAKKNCRGDYVNVDSNNKLCNNDLQAISECTGGLNEAHILEPRCSLSAPKPRRTIRVRRSLEENSSNIVLSLPPRFPGIECRSYGYVLAYYWSNDERVQRALNIRKGTISEWVRCTWGGKVYTVDVIKSTPFHLNLSKRGYRSLVYSGDHDMLVPHWGTQAWIKSLNYSIRDDWRPWLVDTQIAGYTRTYTNNMTFATIKGGGHTGAEYKPKEGFAMVKRWLSYEPL